MNHKVSYMELSNCDKIIVYGAGDVGTAFLKVLSDRNFDKNTVVVWDLRHDTIEERHGFLVSKPDFELYKDAKNVIVVIAFSFHKNESLINEIRQKFTGYGYKNITTSREISDIAETLKIETFVNKAYLDCEYQHDMDFSGMNPLVKPIVFYLPQFHEIPENNGWWGKGFTEWTNTAKAKPKFKGHYQPREPHDDIGYYDLSDPDAIRKQAQIAKRHGIYGWSMYYYWFSGRKLLEKPIDLLLENKDIDINFCLFWCNESWTKIWIGDQKEELIKCEYLEDDPEKFIDDMKKYVEDKRYIRLDGKPLITIYKTQDIPNVQDVVRRWRNRAREIGIGEIAVFSTIIPYTIDDLNLQGCFDGETVFSGGPNHAMNSIRLEDEHGMVSSNFLYRYKDCIENYKRSIETGNHSAYLSAICSWDNSPRYNQQYQIYDLEFSKRHFYDLVKYIIDEAVAYNKEYIFFFAWNEWAEGAYLEPDKRFGYTTLNTFSKAIYGLPPE